MIDGDAVQAEVARSSQVTWFRSLLCSTRTTNRGSSQSCQYFAIVISSANPFICIAPSPTRAYAGRSGCANLAPMAYGTAQPMVAKVPDRVARMSPRILMARIPVRA